MSDAFDLPGFDAGKKGPKRTGKVPPGFKSRERDGQGEKPFKPGPRKPFKPGDAPRRKFEGDRSFKKFDGERPARPSRPYGDRGDKPAWKKDGDFKPRGDRPYKKFDGERPARPYGDRGDKPAWKKDGDFKPRGDRPPFKKFDGERPSRPYGDRGDKPAWKKDGPRKPYGDRPPFKKFEGDRPFRKFEDHAPKPFVPELSPEVKKYLPLLSEKGREKESRFLLEGAKNIADVAENSPEILHVVLVAEGFEDEALKARLDALRVRTRALPAADIAALCGTEAPQGIVAVANFGSLRPDWKSIRSVTLLDGVQDPGNLGAILRTSAALGMDAVVLGKGTCDPYNPKVVRASAAALLRMPLEKGEDLAAKIKFLRLQGFSVVATSPRAPVTLDKATLRRKVALLFGNEGAGVGATLASMADATVRIPMKGDVESLNVAVAHGLLAYELSKLQG